MSTPTKSARVLWQWLTIVVGVGLLSYAMLTASVSHDLRFLGAMVGGVLIVVGLRPERQH